MQVYGVPFSRMADLTLSSTSPVDFDFFQADKGIFAAELATQPGGEIVLISACREGFSPAHSDLADFGRLGDDEIWARVQAGQVRDPLTAAEALALNLIKRRFEITIVSEGFTPAMAQAMSFRHLAPEQLAGYLEEKLAASRELRVGLLRQSAELLPVPQAEAQPIAEAIPA
jgi:nickel-dependent lactate racemase